MNKKRLYRWMLMALAAFLLTGCACIAEGSAGEKISVVTTIFPQYDFVREIAGDRVELQMLLKPGAEMHSYEPSPQEIMSIQQCDLFVYVGGESETWVKTILESAPSDKRTDIALMQLVELAEEGLHEHGEDHEHEHDHGEDHEHEYDEHVWTSPVNAMTIVAELCGALCEVDPANQEYYQANTQSYLEKLSEMDAQFRDVVESAARKKLLFGDRFPLIYFVKEYGLEYSAAFPGCASETEPSAATITQLMQEIVKEKIPVVFYIELSSHQVADILAEQTGVKTELFYTCHNVTMDDFEAGKTYLELMGSNVEKLREALN